MTVSTNTYDATEARAAILANGNGKPVSLRVCTENIPTELKQLDRWVGWRWEWDPKANKGRGKWSKPPANVRTGRRASSTNKSTWCDFSTAYAAYKAGDVDGIGVMLGDLGDGRVLAGIDADGCRDLRTKQLSESVQSVIALVNSYSEVSPTGTGIKILCFGKLPSGAREQGNLECYDSGRYFTVTGHRFVEAPSVVREAETELHEFHGTFIAPPKNTTGNSDRELAVAALRGLASDRADSYRDWINVGMALHASDPGLLEEWDRWSCQSEKYSASACAEKWQSFNGSGLGLGSLIFWARQDGWTPPQSDSRRKNQRREQSNTNHDGESDDEPLPESDPWPDPLDDAALHGLAGEIVKAIETADLGLNPIADGPSIRIKVPSPSAERRQQLVSQVKKMAEDARVAVRNERRDANKHVDQLVKDKTTDVSEDAGKGAKHEVEEHTKKHIARIDEVCKKKVTEVQDV
ncbi:MAG: ribosome recycling factor [Planctomycetes bacterium]|nr:ribosome recycling factor [Planctomycetota bacterium]